MQVTRNYLCECFAINNPAARTIRRTNLCVPDQRCTLLQCAITTLHSQSTATDRFKMPMERDADRDIGERPCKFTEKNRGVEIAEFLRRHRRAHARVQLCNVERTALSTDFITNCAVFERSLCRSRADALRRHPHISCRRWNRAAKHPHNRVAYRT
jgi:hypothetical protein